MVTHSSTSRPVQCLCMAERTGCPVLTDLWSYVLYITKTCFMKKMCVVGVKTCIGGGGGADAGRIPAVQGRSVERQRRHWRQDCAFPYP
jgi:hypothetical protein